jgi:Fe-S-cluster containining protein
MKNTTIFQCTQCGDCCQGYGGTFINENDILAISEYIGISRDQLLEHYCQYSGQKPLLAQANNGYCIFWDGNCKIHPVKPLMCRKWPYLESVLIEPSNWQLMASVCPGINPEAPTENVAAVVRAKLIALRKTRDRLYSRVCPSKTAILKQQYR